MKTIKEMKQNGEISGRLMGCINRNSRVKTLEEIVKYYSYEEITWWRCMGRETLYELIEILHKHGLELKHDETKRKAYIANDFGTTNIKEILKIKIGEIDNEIEQLNLKKKELIKRYNKIRAL